MVIIYEFLEFDSCHEFQTWMLGWQIIIDFFPGNEDIHLLTTRTKNELRIDLQKFSGEKAYAKYSNFSIGSESEKYKIAIAGYSGNAGEITNHLNDREKKIFQ